MTQYRAVPWKRNLRKVPASIVEKIRSLPSDLLYVAVTKQLKDSERPDFHHVAFPDHPTEAARTLPPSDMGIYSKRNREGWEEKALRLTDDHENILLGDS